MKKIFVVLTIFLGLGCARVNVATDKPLKVDINMRIDVYQHVVEDVESVNDQIYGRQEKKFNYLFGCQTAFAADLSENALQAIQRRKSRVNLIEEYFRKGYIGENKDALLQIRQTVPESIRDEIRVLTQKENSDRILIHEEIAEKNNTGIDEVQKVFLNQDYQRAPAGAWFEAYKPGRNEYIWRQK